MQICAGQRSSTVTMKWKCLGPIKGEPHSNRTIGTLTTVSHRSNVSTRTGRVCSHGLDTVPAEWILHTICMKNELQCRFYIQSMSIYVVKMLQIFPNGEGKIYNKSQWNVLLLILLQDTCGSAVKFTTVDFKIHWLTFFQNLMENPQQ